MKYTKILILGFLLAACGGEEEAAPVAPIAPGAPNPGAVAAAPGVAAPGVIPGAAAPGAAPAVAAAAGITRTGALAVGDTTLQSGEFLDSYTFNWNAGETHVVRLSSTVFDPYVIVRPPNGGQQLDNDDLDTNVGTDAGLTVVCATSGQYTVVATSFQPGETGAYTLTIQ
ncbi:MAG: hypothetical protein AB8H86_32460 [Polyangiales bacterium]